MADRAVGVAEAAVPTVLIDNEEVINDLGQTVVRQKTLDPDVVKVLADVRRLLGILVGVAPAREPSNSAARVAVQGTVPVSISTIATVTTNTNQTNWGGLPAQNDQYGHGAPASAALVQRSVRWV